MAILRSSPRQHWMLGVAMGLVVTALLFVSALVRAANAAIPEYQIKAIFLFNFTQFVDWPPDTFSDPHSPLTICVLGEDPFGAVLDDAVHGEMVNGRRLLVQRHRSAAEIKSCQILFMSSSEAQRMAQTLASLRGRSILTVSDVDGFVRNGGIIRMATVAHKVHLRINLDAAQAAKLTISSKLLRPAEIVNRGED